MNRVFAWDWTRGLMIRRGARDVMDRVLVWDLPVRLSHGLLAVGFTGAAAIALAGGEHSPLFPYHAVIGLGLLLVVAFRIVWGFVGTRYARFGSFLFGPVALGLYLRDVLLGGGRRHVGHNPGSAWATFAMFGLVIGLGVTGLSMARGYEGLKEVHEVLAYAMLAVVGAHLLGVAVHTIRHRDHIAASMVRGDKAGGVADAIPSARPLAGLLLLALVGAWTLGLLRNYDAATRTTTVPLWGASLRLGEGAEEGGHERRDGRSGGHGEEHDEDD